MLEHRANNGPVKVWAETGSHRGVFMSTNADIIPHLKLKTGHQQPPHNLQIDAIFSYT